MSQYTQQHGWSSKNYVKWKKPDIKVYKYDSILEKAKHFYYEQKSEWCLGPEDWGPTG